MSDEVPWKPKSDHAFGRAVDVVLTEERMNEMVDRLAVAARMIGYEERVLRRWMVRSEGRVVIAKHRRRRHR